MQKQNLALAVATAALLAASPALVQSTGQGQMQPGETIEALPPAPGADTQDQPAGSAVAGRSMETENRRRDCRGGVETDAEDGGEEKLRRASRLPGEEVWTRRSQAVRDQRWRPGCLEVVEAEARLTGEDESRSKAACVVAQRRPSLWVPTCWDASVQ